MWPFIIAAFIVAIVLAVVLVVYTLGFGIGAGEPEPPEHASRRKVFDPAVAYAGVSWVERIELQRVIGGILVLGGLWHTASPWIFGYADSGTAVASNMIAGLALATVGVLFVIFRGGMVLTWIAGAIGVWVLFAPHLLGFADHGFAVNEAVWGGPITLLLMVLAGLDQWFSEPGRRAPLAGEF